MRSTTYQLTSRPWLVSVEVIRQSTFGACSKSGGNGRSHVSLILLECSFLLLWQIFSSSKRIMAEEELTAKLARRQAINEGQEGGELRKVFNPYTEFPEFTRKTIKDYEATFKKFDIGQDGFLDLGELKRMMEVLGAPQTHLALKDMIQEVDEDDDGKISFREFLLIYRKAQAGEISSDSGLGQLASLTEIDVDQTGVNGAKVFFEAKIEQQRRGLKFEEEIKAEQEERKKSLEEQRERRAAFKDKARYFEQATAS